MEPLSGLDASFFYIETPSSQMQVALAALFSPLSSGDGAEGTGFTARVTAALSAGAARIPALRRKLLRVPLDLYHPVWVDDPEFDILRHVRLATIPAPHDLTAMSSVVSRILSTHLDRSKPLWEVWILEGLSDGRVGVVFQFHHSLADGVSGVELFTRLLEGSTPIDVVEDGAVSTRSAGEGTELPTSLDLLGYAVRSRLRQPLHFLKLVSPSVRAVREVVQRHRTVAPNVGTAPLAAPRTHFNAGISGKRGAAFATISLKDIKRVKDATGTKVNDVVLAVAAGALRRYLKVRGTLPTESLTAVCPISTRSKDELHHSNNRVSAMWSTLATQIADPLERLQRIHQDTLSGKEDFQAVGADMLEEWAELAAPVTVGLGARWYSSLKLAERLPPIHNLILSNVPGPKKSLNLAGARLDALYALGPVMEGVGLNLTVLSYLEEVSFGFTVDQALMGDVWDLADHVGPALEELLRAIDPAA